MRREHWREYRGNPAMAVLLDASERVGNLGREDETDLVRLAQAGDDEAMDKLMVSNIRFVWTVAVKRNTVGTEVADIFEEGMIGLRKGILRFDPEDESGSRLLPYARWWINQVISLHIGATNRTISITRQQVRNWQLIYAKLGECDSRRREFDIETISDETGVPWKTVEYLLKNDCGQTSLNDQLSGHEGSSEGERIDFVAGDNREHYPDKDSEQWLMDTLKAVLKPRDAKIMKHRFWDEMSLEATGNLFGISKEAVRQVEMKSLAKLKARIENVDREAGLTHDDRRQMFEPEVG